MKNLISKFSRTLILLLIAISSVYNLQAQTIDETEVPIIKQTGSRHSYCYAFENKVMNKEDLAKMIKDEKCALAKILDVDFEKQTLISYEARGDCLIRADAKVFRTNAIKTYTVRINNYWGGCRAGGTFQGWLVIDKIPDDFEVVFEEKKIDRREEEIEQITTKSPNFSEVREINLENCIQMYQQKRFVIQDKKAYENAIRNDASRNRCLERKIDFEQNDLIGIQINSGYCRRPLGLDYQLLKDESKKNYNLLISYIDPGSETCRALSRFDLWLLTPKLTENYSIEFDVRGIVGNF